jgi:hypothetical protein
MRIRGAADVLQQGCVVDIAGVRCTNRGRQLDRHERRAGRLEWGARSYETFALGLVLLLFAAAVIRTAWARGRSCSTVTVTASPANRIPHRATSSASSDPESWQ